MSNAVILENVSKQYRISHVGKSSTLQESIMTWAASLVKPKSRTYESIWALKDISLAIKVGEVVGIIGRNGAGKSTMLKILSRITSPTSGEMKVAGRVASLLEVGTGFHEELTGRENIMLNGSILGMRKRQVEERFDAIVEFSGVERFIDTPIKRYSSGMRLRLGFAVAAHLDPDVLIVDEVLAVGDAGFQKKCVQAMEGLRSSGRTVLFVSHNLAAVENLCSRGIWLDAGKVRMDGKAGEVIEAYMASFVGDAPYGVDLAGEDRQGNGDIRYTKIEYLNRDGTPKMLTRSGDDLVIRFHYYAKKSVRYPRFGFRLFTAMGTLVAETGNVLHGVEVAEVKLGAGYIEVEIDSLNLLPAQYYLSLWVQDIDNRVVYDGDARVILEVEPANLFRSGRTPDSRMGIVYFPQRWRVPST